MVGPTDSSRSRSVPPDQFPHGGVEGLLLASIELANAYRGVAIAALLDHGTGEADVGQLAADRIQIDRDLRAALDEASAGELEPVV